MGKVKLSQRVVEDMAAWAVGAMASSSYRSKGIEPRAVYDLTLDWRALKFENDQLKQSLAFADNYQRELNEETPWQKELTSSLQPLKKSLEQIEQDLDQRLPKLKPNRRVFRLSIWRWELEVGRKAE